MQELIQHNTSNCDYNDISYSAKYLHYVHNINLANIASMQHENQSVRLAKIRCLDTCDVCGHTVTVWYRARDKCGKWSSHLWFWSNAEDTVNPLESRGNYSATWDNMKLVHWPLMGELLHLVQRRGAWAGWGPTGPLLAVPNVTAHPSTTNVPIIVLHNGTLLCGFNVAITG